jgi:ribosomal-protein-alanine N-acetyltransferase
MVTIRPVQAEDIARLQAANAAARGFHAPWVAPGAQLGDARRVSLLAEDGDLLVGVVNLSEIVRGPFQSCYMGYYGYPKGVGGGRMTRAVGLAVEYAFGTLGLHRVEANIQPGNTRSIALVRRLGFRLEGFSPAYLFIAGAWRDHERWALVNPSAPDAPPYAPPAG